jgi:hypothetical protein
MRFDEVVGVRKGCVVEGRWMWKIETEELFVGKRRGLKQQ